MPPLPGWGAKGPRLQAFVLYGQWKTMTFLATLRVDGITALCVFDGPINGASFQRYVEQFLLPTLKPGDFAIIDNLSSHKRDAVRAAIASVGARLLFMPPPAFDGAGSTALISTQSSRCSQNSNTCSEKQKT